MEKNESYNEENCSKNYKLIKNVKKISPCLDYYSKNNSKE